MLRCPTFQSRSLYVEYERRYSHLKNVTWPGQPFCCSLRDKFGVIVSLLRFFLIYKTKCGWNGVYKFTYIQDQVRLERCLQIYLYTRPSAAGTVFTNLLIYKTKCGWNGVLKFTYIQDQMRQERSFHPSSQPFCCSLRDKFGVIVSLLPFLLIYKTKCGRNLVLKFTYIQDQVRRDSRFDIYLYTRPSDLETSFSYIQDQVICKPVFLIYKTKLFANQFFFLYTRPFHTIKTLYISPQSKLMGGGGGGVEINRGGGGLKLTGGFWN